MSKILTKLSQFISTEELTLQESYDKLLNQENLDSTVIADDVIDMWEPLEYSLTVGDLLRIIRKE
ncbi:hypothetical protein Phi4:1_gp146 [Cellulophaga phage phi4:1]|uniref:Uncharacterized protein n=5 Tax=Lightbulbvirus TaxID=1918522 RepID=A0A0S2MWP7_9CAUD|nr:hypothetical protein Phi4:1_gp146 [Cellulophaga phage phi4:1]YP_008241645.1 hypothetical protein Phi17:2_gp150 [Cellulophaga phage phi17:2]ALO80155.1 hypothetical protein Phi4113_146 [Cellulophaga phage phi4:1_13]ALO80352.1 hypothetical protein Phi4118_146 [Cellulophaga phage phi4:1_18]ALO80553.1 hypothetical protein Phi17218_150 [Cellulophaga phage phi17:2_18]AGO47683.1 hypothetical protein Phi17:2_gp150 [Cellulophaga phage phi17:2]AGO49559.1 hypothetical protein Phi4:1_gp146 [Cellulophag